MLNLERRSVCEPFAVTPWYLSAFGASSLRDQLVVLFEIHFEIQPISTPRPSLVVLSLVAQSSQERVVDGKASFETTGGGEFSYGGSRPANADWCFWFPAVQRESRRLYSPNISRQAIGDSTNSVQEVHMCWSHIITCLLLQCHLSLT